MIADVLCDPDLTLLSRSAHILYQRKNMLFILLHATICTVCPCCSLFSYSVYCLCVPRALLEMVQLQREQFALCLPLLLPIFLQCILRICAVCTVRNGKTFKGTIFSLFASIDPYFPTVCLLRMYCFGYVYYIKTFSIWFCITQFCHFAFNIIISKTNKNVRVWYGTEMKEGKHILLVCRSR